MNDYQGIVQTDGYDFLDQIVEIIHVACWIHARRKFMAVAKAAGNKNNKSTEIAGKALKYISKLYKIEKEAKKLDLSADSTKRESIP